MSAVKQNGADTVEVSSTHVGRPALRIEDASSLIGKGRYGDDAPVKPGTLHAAILR